MINVQRDLVFQGLSSIHTYDRSTPCDECDLPGSPLEQTTPRIWPEPWAILQIPDQGVVSVTRSGIRRPPEGIRPTSPHVLGLSLLR